MRRFDVSGPSPAAVSIDGGRWRRSVAVWAVVTLFFSVLTAATAQRADASSHVEEKPLIVALCHGNNQSWPQNWSIDYYQDMFSESTDGSSSTIADYWRDISHGRFSIDGTQVLDIELDVDNDAIGDRDQHDFEQCKAGVTAELGAGWENVYAGPVVFKPQTVGRTLNALTDDPTDNTLQVQAEAPSVMDDWPEPPFTLVLTKTGTLWKNPQVNIENTTVTAVDKDSDTNTITFTLHREPQEGYRHRSETNSDGESVPFPSVKAWPADTEVKTISDIYGSKNRTAVVSAQTSPSVINQELGHFFGYDHSRRLSTPDKGYGNCFDVMSTITCTGHYFQVPYAYPGETGNYPAGTLDQYNGPGMVSPFLDLNNWIASDERSVFNPDAFSSCAVVTYSMTALGLSGTGLYQVRVPTDMAIRDGANAEYLAVELRSQQFHWDQGIPRDAFVLNLKGDDDLAYLVDDDDAGKRSGMDEGFYFLFDAGTENDSSDDVYVFANSVDEAGGTGQISLSNCEYNTEVDYTGPTALVYGTSPEVTATMTLWSGAPGPRGDINFTLGSEDCRSFLDANEQEDLTEAACDLDIEVTPGSHDLTVGWDGIDGFFKPDSDTVAVTVAKRGAALQVDEPSATYHTKVTLTATLSQEVHPDDRYADGIGGQIVTLELGTGGDAQSCQGTTTSNGRVSCQINSVEQTPGTVRVTASFAGNDFYELATAVGNIEVQKRATTLTVTPPGDTIYHDPVTLEANLTEAFDVDDIDGNRTEPIAGETVALSIGTGADAQSCTATTDTNGDVECEIDSVEQVPGTVGVKGLYNGNEFYRDTSDSTSFTVEKRDTVMTLSGPGFAAVDGPITLQGTLVEDDTDDSTGRAIEGRDVTLTIGTGADAQSCTATTDSLGVASCDIDDIDQVLGTQPISADFDGDDYYNASSDSGELVVFAWTDGGHFVIGDDGAVVDAAVTFWSSEWYLVNTVSGTLSDDSDSFKGFAHMPSGPVDATATDWTSLSGKNSDPPSDVPEYTAMLVTDTVGKRGPNLTGSIVAVAIVQVDPGYQPDPGHPATGIVIGYLWGSP